MLCHTCAHITSGKTYNLIPTGGTIPEELMILNGWKGVSLAASSATNETIALQCPSCGARFSAQHEWYEFNDTGIPFTHQLTVVKEEKEV